MLRCADEAVPVFDNVFWRAADLSHELCDLLGGDHFDRVPRADGQLVRIRLFAGDMDTNFAPDAAFQVDLAEALQVVKGVVLLDLDDTVDGADLQAGFAAGAIVGIDDGKLFGEFLAWTGFGHVENLRRDAAMESD